MKSKIALDFSSPYRFVVLTISWFAGLKLVFTTVAICEKTMKEIQSPSKHTSFGIEFCALKI